MQGPLDLIKFPFCIYQRRFADASSREIYHTPCDGEENVVEYLSRLGIIVPNFHYYSIRINNVEIPTEWLLRVHPKPGVIVTVLPKVRGGSDVTRSLAFVAVAVAAAVAGPAGAAALGFTGTAATVAGAAISTATVLAGSIVVNALIPAQITGANASLISRSGADSLVSPTYSISGGSNSRRPYSPLLLVLGSHKVFPDLGAIQYTQFEGEDQYLYQIFEFGVAEANLSDIRIGDTLLSVYDNVTTESPAYNDGEITLFPANTQAAAGGALTLNGEADGDYIVRTSASDAQSLRIELEGNVFRVDSTSGRLIEDSMQLDIGYKLSTDGSYSGFLTGIELPENTSINSSGYLVITSDTKKTIRLSLYKKVTEGQYDVRIKRIFSTTDGSSYSSFVTRSMSWTQLLSSQSDDGDYKYRQRYAVRIKASEQLTGAIDKLNATVSTVIPVYDSGSQTESDAESSNPGHIMIFFLRGATDNGGRRIFGAGLADSDIDLTTLRTWADWCDTNSLTCNYVIDSSMAVADVLDIIARCGRATMQWASGKASVVYDQSGQSAVQAFGPFNIKQDTFHVEYLSKNIANEIVVTYIDADRDYTQQEVRVSVPNETDTDRPATIELAGVTNLTQAAEEANLIAASQYYHRKRVTFETDVENLVATRGDVIKLSHDMTSWATGGRVVSGAGTSITIDKSVTVTAGSSYLLVRYPDMSTSTHAISDASGDYTTLTLATSLTTDPDSDANNSPEDYTWIFDNNTSPGKDLKIVGVEPGDEFTARITCVEEFGAYYTSKDGTFTFTEREFYNSTAATVSDVYFDEELLDTDGNTNVFISWTGVNLRNVDVTIRRNGNIHQSYVTQTNTATIIAYGGDVIKVTVIPQVIAEVRDTAEVYYTEEYTVSGLNALPSDVTSITATRNGDNVTLKWAAVTDVDLKHYELRQGTSWDASIAVAEVTGTTYVLTNPSAGTYLLKAMDTGYRYSESAISVTLSSDSAPNFIITQDISGGGFSGTLTNTEVDYDDQYLRLAVTTTWDDLTGTWDSYTSGWDSVVTYATSGTYVTDVIDLGAGDVTDTRVTIDLVGGILTKDWIWDNLTDSWEDYGTGWTWEGPTGQTSTTVEIATSDNGTDFSDWVEFSAGAFSKRYYKFRITLSTETNQVIPYVSDFTIYFDVPDRFEEFQDVSIAASGSTTVTYAKEFNITPNVQVTLQSAAEGDRLLVTSKTTSSCAIQIYDSAGTQKAGNVDVLVSGY